MTELIEEDDVVARNEKVMRRFIDAWAALDVEAAMACLAANIKWDRCRWYTKPDTRRYRTRVRSVIQKPSPSGAD